MFQDLGYALRLLLKNRGFSLIAILTLALGIGANTAVFSIINAVLLRSLPFADADRLVMIWETHPAVPRADASIPDFQDWQAQAQSYEEMAIHSDRFRNAVLTGQGEPVELQGTFVSLNLFSMLGLNPVLGRTFLHDEEEPSNNRVVILSHQLWRNRFNSDREIIGKSIQLNGAPFVVVGVMGDQYPLGMDLWLPLSHLAGDDFSNRRNHRVSVIARLKPGVTLDRARQEMEAIAAGLQQQYPESNRTVGAEVVPLRNQLVGDLRPAVLLIFSAVVLILLIACANVSNLLLAQSATRQRELAVRAALGAGRGRLIRQLLTESLTLALAGGAAGLLVANLSMPILRSALSGIVTGKIPGLEAIAIDSGTLCFLFGITLVTGILFGILPALKISRIDLNQALKQGGKSSAGVSNSRLSRILVMVEVSLATVVLIGAGLLVRSFERLIRVDPGFRADHLLSLKIDLPQSRYQRQEQISSFYDQLMPRVEALPGVESAALIDRLPMAPSKALVYFSAEGPKPEPGRFPLAQVRSVDHRFFEMMRIPLRSGRLFDESDVVNGQPSRVIINETLAKRFFANQDPLDRHILIRGAGDEPLSYSIIGVVADIKDLGVDAPVEPEIFWAGRGREAVLLLRTAGDPMSLSSAVRQTMLSIDPQQPVQQARSVDEVLSTSLARRRLALSMVGVSAVLALVLAAIGIYGVVAYAVTQRTQEIGIRLALGARAGDVLKLIIARGVLPAVFGVAIGLGAALSVARLAATLVAGLLFEVGAADPLTFAATSFVLLAVVLLACYLPARKATRIDPMAAMRHE